MNGKQNKSKKMVSNTQKTITIVYMDDTVTNNERNVNRHRIYLVSSNILGEHYVYML